MTTLLYLVKPGDDNEELRYSLRSLVNFPHDRVVFVGDKPEWVRGVELIPGNRHKSKWLNVYSNLQIAAATLDEFVVMNDDFVVLRPVDGAPSWHRGLLADHIRDCRSGPWKRSLQATLRWLQQRGIADPISYEIHAPVAMSGRQLAQVLGLFLLGDRDLPQWRTLYGNFWKIPATQVVDCKLRKTSTPWDSEWPFVSTDDATFDTHPACREIRSMFPDPSPYEEV